MPADRRSSVQLRIESLGEHRESARAGMARDGSHGIDHCTPEQRRLRALLALAIFNTHGTDTTYPPAYWGLSRLNAYSITVSPRYDRLVLVSDVPHNVVSYLLPRQGSYHCLPGLRLKERRGPDTYITCHVPTGAELIVTGEREGRWPRVGNLRSSTEFQPLSQPLSGRERCWLDEIPEISEAAELLIAGLVCRVAARFGHDWALGNWFYDPLNRPKSLMEGKRESEERHLWGTGSQWLLEWHRFPFEEDVATALAQSPVGVAEAIQVRSAANTVVFLEGARLTLRGFRP
ncbi:hypothetical protein ACQEU3_10440 [Spirillospora sp. CA-253888]